MEEIMLLHDTIHEIHHRKISRVPVLGRAHCQKIVLLGCLLECSYFQKKAFHNRFQEMTNHESLTKLIKSEQLATIKKSNTMRS
jgi:hypothetical protein